MGLKGQRQNSQTKYQEPDLLADVDSIIKNAQEKGYYSGSSLSIESVISTFNDIEVRYEEMEPNQSGSFKFIDNKWIIGINKSHHKNRQKFTLAHELGHYILHREKNINIVDTTFFRNNETDSIEYMANEFASKLLMPEEKVRDLVDSQGIKNIGELAEKFEVSASAMKYRIVSLGYKLKDNV
jgi:Zn-dependent peptidase ImmA (M78 family)